MSTIQEVGTQIRNDLNAYTDRKSIALLFAFNATWKTRLSIDFDWINEEGDNFSLKVLSYNAFLEDLFIWDNENLVIKFSTHWVINFIEEQGLEGRIKEIYLNITCSKVAPEFNYEYEFIAFPMNEELEDGYKLYPNIKISKSEESILIWAIFYSILEIAIEALNTGIVEDRSTHLFDNLEYIVIDDPVSSIDDARIIAIAVKLFETIESSNNTKLNFLITTHHALFYNVLFNSFSRISKSEAKKRFYILSRNANNTLNLEGHNEDTPFAYHLLIIKKIQESIESNSIERHHFNLFRSLLEKTANFLGKNNFSECVLWEKKEQFVRMINVYSHGKISELEPSTVTDQDKVLFQEAFNEFLVNFKYN